MTDYFDRGGSDFLAGGLHSGKRVKAEQEIVSTYEAILRTEAARILGEMAVSEDKVRDLFDSELATPFELAGPLDAAEHDIKKQFAAWLAERTEAIRAENTAWIALQSFRRENNVLDREPQYPADGAGKFVWKKSRGWGALETLANGSLFADFFGGVIGGVGLAGAITLANFGFGATLGELCRQKNHVSKLIRVLAIITIVLNALFLVAGNVGVAILRLILESGSLADIATDTTEVGWTFASLLLCLGVIAATKYAQAVYQSSDPVPGYEKTHKTWLRARDARRAVEDSAADYFNETEAQLGTAITAVVKRAADVANDIATERANYQNKCSALYQMHAALAHKLDADLNEYRAGFVEEYAGPERLNFPDQQLPPLDPELFRGDWFSEKEAKARERSINLLDLKYKTLSQFRRFLRDAETQIAEEAARSAQYRNPTTH